MRSFVGLDIGGTSIKIGILDSDFRVLQKSIIPVDPSDPEESMISAWEITKKLCEAQDCIPVAAGIACPGPIDFAASSLCLLPNLPDWNGFRIKKFSSEKFGIPVVLENDANAAAIAEGKIGAGMGCKMLVLVTLGTGVGGGLLYNGQIIHGAWGGAGEIGHIAVQGNVLPCGCGRTGCLETLIGKAGVLANYNSRVDSSKHLSSIPDLISLLKNENREAIECFEWIGKTLGSALSTVTNFLDPDCILIGGGISNAGEILIQSIHESIMSNSIPSQGSQLRVAKAVLGNDAGFVGAAILASEMPNVLSD